MVDPRDIALPNSVNEELMNRSLRHAVFVQKFKTHEVNKMVALLNKEVIPDLVSQMKSRLSTVAGQRGHLTNLRLKALFESNKQILRAGLSKANSMMAKDMKAFALSEAEWQTKVFNKATPSIFGIDYTTPPPPLLKSIVTSKPFDGKLLKDHFSKLSSDAQRGIKKSIKTGMATGESLPQIMRRVRGSISDRFSKGDLGKLRRNTEVITRTSTAHVSNNARIETYKENNDVVKGFQFLATLDSRTTDICMVRDGKVFDLNNTADMPPLHHQCRSDTTPVLKTWEEMDIKGVKEAPESTRAALGGPVSEKVVYPEWLAKQSPKMQNLALGKGRANLFREGKLPFENLINDKNQPLSLKQLRRLSEKTDGIKMPDVVKREKTADIIKPKPDSVKPAPVKALATGKEVRHTVRDKLTVIDKDIASLNKEIEGIYKDDKWVNDAGAIRRARKIKRQIDIAHGNKVRALSDEMKIQKGMTADFETRRITSSKMRKGADTAKKFLEAVIPNHVGGKMRTHLYPIKGNDRSFFRRGNIHLAGNARAKNVIHEFGHKLEYSNEKVRRAAQEFLKKRALDDPNGLRPLNKITNSHRYRDEEMAWKDKFMNAYMGKHYADGSTEIMSVGLEMMWKDPLKLMTMDPEYFDFIVDVVRGHIP